MKKVALAALMAAMLGGCGSLINQERQTIHVTTRDADGAVVDHAHCVLSSMRGVWTVDTPGDVTVSRSNYDLNVDCTRPGHDDGTVHAISNANEEMFGNVVLGIVPMAYDFNSGGGLSYPDSVAVTLGKSKTIEARPLK
jgi:hypothetical protein